MTVAWMYGIVWMACISGSHITILARMSGFNDFAFGLLAAVPFLATTGQLVASVLVERSGLRKYQFLYCGTIHRLLWLPIALVPLLLPIPSLLAVTLILLLRAISDVLGHMATPAWWTWMGDLIPRRIRGRYFAARARYAMPAQIVVVLAIGIGLDLLLDPDPTTPETAAAQPIVLYFICGVLGVAALSGAVDILLFRRIREIAPTRREPNPRTLTALPRPWQMTLPQRLARAGRSLAHAWQRLIVDPLRDRVFRRYVLFGAVLTFGVTSGGWYYWLLALEYLKLSKTGTNLLFMVIGPLFGFASAGLWGRLVDRYGRRPVLIIATAGTILGILPWYFAMPDTPNPAWLTYGINAVAGTIAGWFGQPGWLLIGPGDPFGIYLLAATACMIGGISWTGVNLAQTGILLSFSDGQGRSRYVAASAVLIGIGGVLGGLAAGLLAQHLGFLRQTPLMVGPLAWINWHAAITLSALALLLGTLLLRHMPDPGAAPVGDVIRSLRSNVYNAVAPRLLMRLRVFGWLQRNGEQDDDPPQPR